MSASPRLSIVIVSWNSRSDLEACLASIRHYTNGLDYEVIVVDNASTDETVQTIRVAFPEVRLIENTANAGFARACNQGMAASVAEFVLLLNADTYVEDNVIGRSIEALQARPEIALLGCRLAYPDGRLQHTANRSLSIRRSLFEMLWLYKLVPKARRSELLLNGHWAHDHEIEVDWLAGVFLLLRRSLYLESGGFDERFFMYGEDSEWCMRLRRMGHRILFTPQPGTVLHTGSVSSDLVWSDKERLKRCYLGGIDAYTALNGPTRAAGYRAAELLGAVVRLAVYSAMSLRRSDPYHAAQARLYRWRIEFYLGQLGEFVK
jgi:GT2 family glycosyltransferase